MTELLVLEKSKPGGRSWVMIGIGNITHLGPARCKEFTGCALPTSVMSRIGPAITAMVTDHGRSIRDAGLAPYRVGLIDWIERLVGTEIERRVPGRASPREMAMPPPLPKCLCAQDALAPTLPRFAEGESLVSIRFCTKLSEHAPDAEGLIASIFERTTGAAMQIRAYRLIAGDGTPTAPLQQRITTYDRLARPEPRSFGRAGGEPWARAAAGLAPKRRARLGASRNGADLTDLDVGFAGLYGLNPDGAALVRPDGDIAFLSRDGTADPEKRLAAVLWQMLAQSAAGA